MMLPRPLMMKLIGMKLPLLIKILSLKKFTQLQSAFSQRIFKKDFIIGLDIGTTSIKLAKFVKKEDGMYLSKVEIIEIKPDIRDASKEDTILSSLKKALKGTNIKKSKFIAAINCPNTAVKSTTVPYMPKGELTEGIRLEAKNYFPFSMDEALLDFEISGEMVEKGVKKYKLLVATSPQKTVDKYTSLLNKVGVKPSSFVPAPLTLQKIVENTYSKEDEIKAILDIGERFAELAIFSGKELVFQRKLPVAGGDFTEAMTSVLASDRGRIQLTLAEAEKIKREVGLPLEGESKMIEDKVSTVQILSMLRPPLEQLVNEIDRCFDYYREETKGARVDSLILFGAGSLLKGLDEFLSEKLAVEVKLGNPLEGLKTESNTMSSETIIPQRLALAVGAALSQAKGVNLLPPEIKYETKRIFKRTTVKSITATVILILAFIYIGMKIQLGNFEKRITVARMELASLNPQLEQAKVGALVNSILAHEPFWEDVFMELSNLIHSDIYTTRLSMQNNLINIRGIAVLEKKEEPLSDFILALEKGLFKNVRLVQSTVLREEGATEFELKCWVD